MPDEDIEPAQDPTLGKEEAAASLDGEPSQSSAEPAIEQPTQKYAPDASDSTLDEVLQDDEDRFEPHELLARITLTEAITPYSGQPGKDDKLALEELTGGTDESARVWLVNDALVDEKLDEFARQQIIAWCQPIAPQAEFLMWNGEGERKPSQISECLRQRGKGNPPCVILIELGDQAVSRLQLDNSSSDLADAARAANAHVLFIVQGQLDTIPRTVRLWKPDLTGCRLRRLVWEHLNRIDHSERFADVMDMLKNEIPELSARARKASNLVELLDDIETKLQPDQDEPDEIAQLVRSVLKAPANARDDEFNAILERVFTPSFASEPKLPVLCEVEGPLEPYASVLFALHAFNEARVQPERRAFNLFVRKMLEGKTVEVRKRADEDGKSVLVAQDLWGLYERNAGSIRQALDVSYRDSERRGYLWMRKAAYQTLGAMLNERVFEYRDVQRKVVLAKGLCLDREPSVSRVAIDILRRQISPIETEDEQKKGALEVAAAFGLYKGMNEVQAAKAIAAQLLPSPNVEEAEPKENQGFIRALADYLISRVNPRVGGNFVLRILLERPHLIDFSWLLNIRLPGFADAAARFLDGVEVLCRRKNTDGTGLQVLLGVVSQRLADDRAPSGSSGPDIWAAVAIRLATGVALGLDWKDYQPAAEPTYQSASVRSLAGDANRMRDVLCLLFTRRVALYLDRVDGVHRAMDPVYMSAWNSNERLRLLTVAMRLKCKFPPQDNSGGAGYSGSPFQPPAERMAEEFLQEKEWAHLNGRGDTVGFTATSLEIALSREAPSVEEERQRVLPGIPFLVVMEVLVMAGLSGRAEVAMSVKNGILQQIETRGNEARREFERFERMASKFYREGNLDLLEQADRARREKAVDAATYYEFREYLKQRRHLEPRISKPVAPTDRDRDAASYK